MKNTEKKYFIYSYELEDKNVYVGLTMDIFTRHKAHCYSSKDALRKFCKEHGYELTFPIILEHSLTGIEAQSKEHDWVGYYKSNDYTLINKGKTGIGYSSLGNTRRNIEQLSQKHGGILRNIQNELSKHTYLTFDQCYKIAASYKTKKDFRLNDTNTYCYAQKMGWLTAYTWLTNSDRKWNLKQHIITIDEYLAYAKKCKTKTEFSILYRPYYIWGLKNNLNDKTFVKKTKTQYHKPKSFGELTFEEASSMARNFTSRTELYKTNHALYEYCRNKGWLKKLSFKTAIKNSKEKKYEKMNNTFNVEEIDMSRLKEIVGFPKYLIDVDDCKVYRVLRKKIHELSPSIDGNSGLKFYYLYTKNYDSRCYPYHKLVKLALYSDKDYNCVRYIDGDYSNVKIDNLEFFHFTTEGTKQVHHYYNTLINDNGDIYNRTTETLNMGVTIKDGEKYIGEYSISNLVYSLFVYKIEPSEKPIHIDGDLFNNNVNNLQVCGDNSYILYIDDLGGTYKLYLKNHRDKEILIGKLWSDSVVKEVKKKIEYYLKKYNTLDEWLDNFINNEYDEYLKIDKKFYTDKIHTEGSGCYWFEPRKCWKSKIYTQGKEWSLGYFDVFEHGKMIYEIATIAIKYGYFESWYKNIKSEREIIKSCER